MQNGETPINFRLAQMSERVQSLNFQPKNESKLNQENFESQIKYLDEQLQKSQKNNDQKFSQVADQLGQINEQVESYNENRENSYQKIDNGISTLETEFSKEINGIQKIMKDTENKQIKNAEEKQQFVKQIINIEIKKKQSDEKQIEQEILQQIQLTQEAVQYEKQQREIKTEDLIKKFGEEILEIQEILNQEKNVQLQAQLLNKIFDQNILQIIFKNYQTLKNFYLQFKIVEDRFSDMINGIQELDKDINQQIQEEKKQRERNEETLLKLLDETCNKIESVQY